VKEDGPNIEFCEWMLNVQFQYIILRKSQSQPIPLVVMSKLIYFMKNRLSPVILIENLTFVDGSLR
jgi:hypothetical protein